ncbi:MAG TPA: hypothetical protein VN493_31215 [Thermoanaerobaculia bacterium]|nr:hypothetical protein [Thermoanaerobaculia bacterium]
MGGIKAKADLFAIAAENTDTLERNVTALLAGIPPAHLDSLTRYSDTIQRDSRISVNMLQTMISSFLSLQQHWNMYEWAHSMAKLSSRAPEEILRERLGDFYERRIAFDGRFVNGESFRYGALNIGGLGTWYYGEYCVVLKEEVSHRPEVAYLRSDSLKTYMRPGPAVDEEAIRRDAAPHTHRHCLALLKHAERAPSTEEPRWPAMLCSNDDYVEAIFTGQLTPDQVEAVRMPKADYEVRFHFAILSFREKLSDHDKFLVAEFRTTLVHLKQRNIPVEAI